MSWLGSAVELRSKGSRARKASSLGDLHRRRRETGAQYFTGQWVSAGLWSVLNPLVGKGSSDRSVSVVDTSIGNGRLLEFADTQDCELYGIDVDERCVQALADDAEAAGIRYTFEPGRMEDLTISGFDIAVINPPFSLTLQSPHMSPYPCTHFGRFGPGTSALSHEYALAQALDAADIVAALLPATMAEACRDEKRLAAIYWLPLDVFAEEGATVSTAVFVFDACQREQEVIEQIVDRDSPWNSISLQLGYAKRTIFRLGDTEQGEPTITLPVTGDRTVRVEHHNRRLVLKFECGLTQAKVLNGILVGDVKPADKHRYPKGVRYIGDARLWMDVWLLQDNPQRAFESVLEMIRSFGGEPVVSSTLQGFWKKLQRRHRRAMTPFRHWVKTASAESVQVVAKRSSLLRAGDLSSPTIKKGETLTAKALGGEYRLCRDGQQATISRDDFDRRFKRIDDDERTGAAWQLVAKGLVDAFPEAAETIRARIRAAGIDWLWPFQEDGAIEHLLKPYGSVAAWKQGLGKARLAIALALLSGKHSLIVVESGLVDEMKTELRDKLALPESLWRVISRSDDVESLTLRQINITSYNTLKNRVRGRKTLAKLLRRQFHTVIADEGGILANPASQQSRALMALAPRKLIVSDGTPIGSYPRDMLPVAAACAGNAVAHQPFGLRHGAFVEQRLMQSASYMMRGVDEFRQRHVVLEWVTNQFKDDNRTGAKREIPRINDVVNFRQWLQPNVQRKVRYEPEVEPYAACPKPIYQTTEIPWDKGHLKHYLDVALHFANWYMQHLEECTESGRGTNLITVLARIGAVMAAANQPHKASKHSMGCYMPLTSKQRMAIEKIERYVAEGKKTILFAYSPSVVERLADELEESGIQSVKFHGGIPIKMRTRALNEEFRYGDTDVLLSTWVGQTGLNIPQAKRIILYNRSWVGRTEDQAIHRTQRPDQDERVIVDRLHIKGSIDEYVAQVVDWKVAAADSGLDWGDGITETEVFQHLDSIIETFCRDTLDMSSRDAFEALAA